MSQNTNELPNFDVLSINDCCVPFPLAQKTIFNGKSREWIRYYIFDRYPEVFTDAGGWITRPKGSGDPAEIMRWHGYMLIAKRLTGWHQNQRHYIVMLDNSSNKPTFSRVGLFFT